MLRLESDSVSLPIQPPLLAHHRTGEEVAGVYLQAGLCGQQLEHPARTRIFEPRRPPQTAGRAAQHEIMVIAARDDELRFRSVPDPSAHHVRGAKVECRTSDGAHFTRRYQISAGGYGRGCAASCNVIRSRGRFANSNPWGNYDTACEQWTSLSFGAQQRLHSGRGEFDQSDHRSAGELLEG
jgi:hypothetical protein